MKIFLYLLIPLLLSLNVFAQSRRGISCSNLYYMSGTHVLVDLEEMGFSVYIDDELAFSGKVLRVKYHREGIFVSLETDNGRGRLQIFERQSSSGPSSLRPASLEIGGRIIEPGLFCFL